MVKILTHLFCVLSFLFCFLLHLFRLSSCQPQLLILSFPLSRFPFCCPLLKHLRLFSFLPFHLLFWNSCPFYVPSSPPSLLPFSLLLFSKHLLLFSYLRLLILSFCLFYVPFSPLFLLPSSFLFCFLLSLPSYLLSSHLDEYIKWMHIRISLKKIRYGSLYGLSQKNAPRHVNFWVVVSFIRIQQVKFGFNLKAPDFFVVWNFLT